MRFQFLQEPAIWWTKNSKTMMPQKDGELGELVFTTLTKEGLPLIRYRTKDLTSIDRSKCDCGRTTEVSSTDLTSGNTKSCGCLGNNYAKRNLMKGGYWYGKKDF